MVSALRGGGERFPAGQFTAEYLAPEFQKTGKVPEKQEEWQDRFALAVILFQLLNFGLHPYIPCLPCCCRWCSPGCSASLLP